MSRTMSPMMVSQYQLQLPIPETRYGYIKKKWSGDLLDQLSDEAFVGFSD